MKTFTSTRQQRTHLYLSNALTRGGPTLALLLGAIIGCAFAERQAHASDPVGVYGIVQKVVLEPNAQAPERAQVWGAFALAEGRGDQYAKAKKGFLYVKLNPENPELCRREWKDLKAMAGTGEVIAFGSRRSPVKPKVRLESEQPKNPDVYPLGWGLSKVRQRDYTPIQELVELMRNADRPTKPGKKKEGSEPSR